MNTIVRNLLFPFHESLKGHSTIKMLKELERSQWLKREEIIGIQKERLAAFIKSVKEDVPYYKSLLNGKGAFEDIPFQTKKEIRGNTERLRSARAGRLQRSNTGGSTGEPLIFYLGKRRISADIAAKVRATRWWGVDIGDREVVIWGSPVELTKQDRIRQVRDSLFRTRLLSAFDMNDETMGRYAEYIRKFRPRHVFGYPSSIYLLCRYARKKGVRLDDLGVKVVFCTAERLYDHQRDFISETFSAPVANGYGGRDAGFIAHECPEGRMHLTDENIIVEIADPAGNILKPGESGEIVVTQLESGDFPFLRYRTGDIGVVSDESCPCGRNLGVLKSVEGRSTDFIVAPDGRIMHGLALIYVVRDTEGVEGFKILQEERDSIKIFLSVNQAFTEKSEERIRIDFTKRLGGDVKLEFVYKDRVQPEKSGKFRYVESKVKI